MSNRPIYKTVVMVMLFVSHFLFQLTLHAQQHSIGFSADVVSPVILDRVDLTSSRLGIGGNVHLLYRYQYRYFLINTGLGMNYEYTRQQIELSSDIVSMRDTRETFFRYIVNFKNRYDQENIFALSVPLHFGFEVKHFYALFGGALVLPLSANGAQKAEFQTIGDYDGRYIDLIEDVPSHGFHDFEDISNGGRLKVKPDLRAEVQVGYTFTRRDDVEEKKNRIFKIGLYAQFSCFDIFLSGSAHKSLIDINYSKYVSVNLNNVYTTELGRAMARKLAIGIRFTYLIPVSGRLYINHSTGEHYKRYKCMCVRPSRKK